ncbi:MAG: hypothetical protein GY875_13445, partial [Gammaproteobacteria bacterium]|nr:hypothetical protein [Gammaproteobacteria bacterium]
VEENIAEEVVITSENDAAINVQGLAGTGISAYSDTTSDIDINLVGIDQTGITSNSGTPDDVTINTSGDISVGGIASSAVEANTGTNGATGAVTINNTGDIAVSGVVNTGMSADGATSTVTNLADGTITVDGVAATGVSASNGGTATNEGTIDLTGDNATGMQSEGQRVGKVQGAANLARYYVDVLRYASDAWMEGTATNALGESWLALNQDFDESLLAAIAENATQMGLLSDRTRQAIAADRAAGEGLSKKTIARIGTDLAADIANDAIRPAVVGMIEDSVADFQRIMANNPEGAE